VRGQEGVGFPCATAGSVVSAQDAYYGDIVAERELTCGCQSLEKEFAFASTGAIPRYRLPAVVSDWNGDPITDGGNIVAAGDARIHAQAVKMLRR